MNSCTEWLMIFIKLVDGFQSSFLSGIRLLLKETYLSLKEYLLTVTESINQLSNVVSFTVSNGGIKLSDISLSIIIINVNNNTKGSNLGTQELK